MNKDEYISSVLKLSEQSKVRYKIKYLFYACAIPTFIRKCNNLIDKLSKRMAKERHINFITSASICLIEKNYTEVGKCNIFAVVKEKS